MEALQSYGVAEKDGEKEKEQTRLKIEQPKVNAAPDVKLRTTMQQYETSPTTTTTTTLSLHSSPSQGKNSLAGFVQEGFVDNFSFEEQYHSFNNNGHALDPTGGLRVIYNKTTSFSQPEAKKEKRKREAFGNPEDLETFRGPWAHFEDEEKQRKEFAEAADRAAEGVEKLPEAPKKAKVTEEEATPIISTNKREVVEAKSVFHGKILRDYLGRTYIDPPSHLKPSDHECFLPKRLIHTWPGHSSGVSAIRLFPTYGHLILSGGMDNKVKIWDVYNKQRLLRTYMGHSKAIRDISFNYDGRRFVSASYDRKINLWDTETGECLGSYSNGSIPYCVKFHPDPGRGHMFLAGCSDKKIIQWDTNSGKITQQYDQHLGAVNTITFVDGNRRFVTSADDKSIRVWEWAIPVVIKYISEPHMHSMPAITLHPEGGWFAAQSQDNQIVVYSAQNKFKINKKKRFVGHMTSGYACQIDFSPDGHFIMSGDADGKLWFWDWNNGRVLKSLQAHDGVCIGAVWHPIEPSRIVTCGWDGTIKYWD